LSTAWCGCVHLSVLTVAVVVAVDVSPAVGQWRPGPLRSDWGAQEQDAGTQAADGETTAAEATRRRHGHEHVPGQTTATSAAARWVRQGWS